MQAAVWSQLVDGKPPEDEPYFPFTAGEVRQMRIDSGGELRTFLQLAQQGLERRLNAPPKPPPRETIRLTAIEPREVMSHEPTAVLIQGENLPAEVRVLFAGQTVLAQPVCRPAEGQIDATTPTGLVGDVEVRVEARDDPDNAACLLLRFVEREVPRPYCRHIDRRRLKARREELKLTQKDVAQQVGSLQPYISRLETGRWTDAPDELFVRLAEVYGLPLSQLLKR
jgi:DNA-binding XRE family transcriptional regulator